MSARKAALEAMEKRDLVEIVLRLQEQVRAHRTSAAHALEDGIAEGLRRARVELASRDREAVP